MRKRVQVALAVLVVAILVITIGRLTLREREPVYHGKRLSVWLKAYRINESIPVEAWKAQGEKSDEAVRQLGSEAVPTLLRMLRARDSALKSKVMDLAERQHIIGVDYTPAEELNHRARRAFEVLGAKAQSAVPALMEIAKQNISRTSQSYAIHALAFIGPSAREAVPLLLQWATNADYELRGDAIFALGKIGGEPDRVLPALIAALQDPTSPVRFAAVWALEDFGPDAKSAVPALVEFFNAQDDGPDKSLAANALNAIDPEAAAKVGVK